MSAQRTIYVSNQAWSLQFVGPEIYKINQSSLNCDLTLIVRIEAIWHMIEKGHWSRRVWPAEEQVSHLSVPFYLVRQALPSQIDSYKRLESWIGSACCNTKNRKYYHSAWSRLTEEYRKSARTEAILHSLTFSSNLWKFTNTMWSYHGLKTGFLIGSGRHLWHHPNHLDCERHRTWRN